ncbi:BrnT family toxin [Okeania sp.]|uniref:BrnT family toxin n=1 Tax=Okeania sp. TaxID=3100323 RepID=UPI0035C8C5A4
MRKHGISFEEAAEIFYDIVFTVIDERYNYGEIREISTGAILLCYNYNCCSYRT